MEPVVIRPRIQIAALAGIFGVFLLLGLMYFTVGGVLARRDWFGVVMGIVCTLAGAAGVWSALRMGVVVDANGIRIRGFGSRDKLAKWAEVDAIATQQIGTRKGLPLYAPVIKLASGEGQIPVRPLGTYSQADARRKAELIRSSARRVGRRPPKPARQ